MYSTYAGSDCVLTRFLLKTKMTVLIRMNEPRPLYPCAKEKGTFQSEDLNTASTHRHTHTYMHTCITTHKHRGVKGLLCYHGGALWP